MGIFRGRGGEIVASVDAEADIIQVDAVGGAKGQRLHVAGIRIQLVEVLVLHEIGVQADGVVVLLLECEVG